MHWFYFSRYRFIEPPRSADEILSSFLLCPWTDKQNLQPTRYFPLNISFFFFPFLFRLGSISSKFSFFLRGCLPFFHFFHFFIKDPDVQFILPLRIYAVPAWESQWMWLIGTMSSRFLSLSFCFFFFFLLISFIWIHNYLISTYLFPSTSFLYSFVFAEQVSLSINIKGFLLGPKHTCPHPVRTMGVEYQLFPPLFFLLYLFNSISLFFSSLLVLFLFHCGCYPEGKSLQFSVICCTQSKFWTLHCLFFLQNELFGFESLALDSSSPSSVISVPFPPFESFQLPCQILWLSGFFLLITLWFIFWNKERDKRTVDQIPQFLSWEDPLFFFFFCASIQREKGGKVGRGDFSLPQKPITEEHFWYPPPATRCCQSVFRHIFPLFPLFSFQPFILSYKRWKHFLFSLPFYESFVFFFFFFFFLHCVVVIPLCLTSFKDTNNKNSRRSLL